MQDLCEEAHLARIDNRTNWKARRRVWWDVLYDTDPCNPETSRRPTTSCRSFQPEATEASFVGHTRPLAAAVPAARHPPPARQLPPPARQPLARPPASRPLAGPPASKPTKIDQRRFGKSRSDKNI